MNFDNRFNLLDDILASLRGVVVWIKYKEHRYFFILGIVPRSSIHLLAYGDLQVESTAFKDFFRRLPSYIYRYTKQFKQANPH